MGNGAKHGSILGTSNPIKVICMLHLFLFKSHHEVDLILGTGVVTSCKFKPIMNLKMVKTFIEEWCETSWNMQPYYISGRYKTTFNLHCKVDL